MFDIKKIHRADRPYIDAKSILMKISVVFLENRSLGLGSGPVGAPGIKEIYLHFKEIDLAAI